MRSETEQDEGDSVRLGYKEKTVTPGGKQPLQPNLPSIEDLEMGGSEK